ncbi:MAG: metallophosphoesterase family protein [Clostridia bacterium]
MASVPRSGAPGRACPLSYRYGAASLAAAPSLRTETLWVAGGLYGNPASLRCLLSLFEEEKGEKALVFNGDFHWFDVFPDEFSGIEEGVEKHLAIRGNVETELAAPVDAGGCGCGYPEWVDDGTVERSNAIMASLAATARRFPEAQKRLAALPMHLVAEVGGERIGVVHGDADSLSGWGFSQEALATDAGMKSAQRAFAAAGVRVFASSHSCLPVLQTFPGERVVVNNGAAGMPNFAGERFGIATRISTRPSKDALYGLRAGCLHVEAIALRYDAAAWEACFLAQWPAGSPAHRSYFERIVCGPRYGRARALRAPAPLAA